MLSKALSGYLSMKSPHTQRTYSSVCRSVEKFFSKPLEKLSTPELLTYFAELRDLPGQLGSLISVATISHRFHVLNSIYEFLVDMSLVNKNPMRPIKRMISWRQKTQKRPTAFVNAGVIRKLLRLGEANKIGVRDRAIYALLFGAGLRRSEALALNVDDVRVSEKDSLYVVLKQTKAGKLQTRTIAPFARRLVTKLVTQRSQEGAKAGDPLLCFYYKDGRIRGRMDQKTLYRRFRSSLASLGVQAAPHAARATFATMLKEANFDDRDVGAALGHSGGNMVRVYDKRKNGVDDSIALALKKVVGT